MFQNASELWHRHLGVDTPRLVTNASPAISLSSKSKDENITISSIEKNQSECSTLFALSPTQQKPFAGFNTPEAQKKTRIELQKVAKHNAYAKELLETWYGKTAKFNSTEQSNAIESVLKGLNTAILMGTGQGK